MEMIDDTVSQPLITNDHGLSDLQIRSIVRRLNWRLLTLCTTLLLLSGINHENISFGANEFCADLQLNNTQYGLGILACYLSMTLVHPIANQFLKRLGAPTWFALILSGWGGAGVALGFVQKPWQYYGLMFVSGAAHAGSYSGVLYYSCLFYPPRYLDSAFSYVIAASAFALPLTAGLAMAMVGLADVTGWAGWRMILVGMGVLPILYSAIVFFILPASLKAATFLTHEEKEWIEAENGRQNAIEESMSFIQELKHIMCNVQVHIAGLAAICSFGVEIVLMFFLNLIVRTALDGENDNNRDSCGTSGGNQMTSIALAGIPYICSGVVCTLMGRYGDRIKKRKLFAIVLQLASGLLLIVWGQLNALSFEIGYIALTVSIILFYPPQVVIFSLATVNAAPPARSMALAYLNTIFSIGGLIFPVTIGALTDAYGYRWSTASAGLLGLLSAVVMVVLKDPLAE